MATWKEVRSYIRDNYTLKDDESDFFSLVFDLDNSRTQLVLIKKSESLDGVIWVQMASPVGVIDEEDIDSALTFISSHLCGGLIKDGGHHFIRHSMPIDDLSENELDIPLMFIAKLADDLERRFVGGDEL